MTTSGYILRLKDLITTKMSNLVNPGCGLNKSIVGAEAGNKTFTKETALQVLLDQGMSQQEADLVVATMEEWGFPLEQVSVLDFEVHGESVWIKPD